MTGSVNMAVELQVQQMMWHYFTGQSTPTWTGGTPVSWSYLVRDVIS
jgi:hypothetical protein